MAKQPRLPASDRAPTSEQRNRGVRAYPTSTTSTFPAQPQQSVATHEIADAPNKSIRREDASGSSLPLTHSGKLLSHVENPAYSFTQHQATSRPKQLPTSITPEGNRNGHRLPRAMPTSGGSTAEPTNSREPRTSSDSPDLTSKSGPKSNEGNSESSHRVKQIPTAPRSDRPRVLSKAEEEEQARRQARIQRFSEVKQALSNDASQQQLERPVQQAASVQARRTSQEQARPSRTSASNALLQMKDREPATSSSAVNDPVLTDGWPITANQEELSAHTAQISDQHPAQNTNNSSPVNFGSPNVALPITVRHNGQNIYHHDGHGGTGSIGIAQDHVMAGDGASHARAPAEEDGMVVICDIPKEELSSVGASRAQRSSATPNVNMENTNDGDVDVDDRSRRGSTPLTPSPSEAGDLPGESEGTDISETRSQPAKVAGVPENSNKEKLSRSRREEDSRADQTPRAKSRSGPSLAKPMEPEQVPKSPSVPPMSPALPAENQIRDDLDGPAFALEGSNIPEPVAVGATVSTISERKRSKRLTKTVDPTKKVVFDGIATSNIIPSDGWGPQRTTRRAAKSNTQQTAYLPDASRAVEQKPRLQSAEKPPTSSTAPGAKLGHMAGKRKYHTDVIEVQNPDGTFRVIAEDGVFLDGTPVEPPSDQGASVIDENPSTSGRRSLRSRISSATPMGPQHTATEKTHHGLPLALSSPSTSRLDPHSKRKVVDVSASVTIETLQDSPMGHTIEESKLARTRSVPVSKRKASNVHKQTVVQATSGEVAIGGLALLGASDPVASHQSRSKRTGQPSRAIQPQVALRPANEAEPSTSSRTSARKKAKAADHLSEGTPEVPLAVQTSTQQSVHASAAHGNAEDDHVVRNVENHVPTSNGTVRSRNAGSNGPIQQLDEFLASQKVQTVTLAQRIQEAQDTTQESLYEIELKMQETMRQMQNLAQRMIAQNLALVKEQQQRSVDNEKAVLKLREQLASSATQPPAPIVRRKAVAQRSEANLIDQQQLSTRHEENSVRMPEEQTSSAAMRPAPRLSKKQVSSRQKGSVSIIQESEQRRSAPKKRKADNDGDYQHDETAYSAGKGKKKKKDGNEERSRSDALGGDSRLINRPKKNYSIPDMDLAMSDADAEQPLEHEHEQEPKRIAETIRLSLIDHTEEVQMGECTMSRYDGYQLCKDCSVQATTGCCRFKGWRIFPIDPKQGSVKGEPWFDHQTAANEALEFPSELNRDFSAQQSFRMKETVVKALLPVITKELLHCVNHGAKRKAHDIASRATCDRCSMTIFGGSWSCICCGKEYCFECESDIPDNIPPSTGPIKEGSSEDRLLSCGQGLHTRRLLFATTTFELSSLQYHWLQMVGFAERAGILYDKQDVKQLLTNENASEILFPTVDIETVQPGQQEERNRAQATENITDDMLKSFLTKQSHDSHELPPEAIEEFDSHPFYRIDASKLNEPTFDRMWRDGIPIVIDNAKSYLREDWSPKGFQKLFGDEKCTVYDCQAEIGEDSTINKFFGLFNSRPPDGGAHKVLKLKDWPTTEEFKERCPSLNQDFHNTLPVPDYTRRDGVTNVSAFFPINTNPPDIGPKLYSALRGIETEGGKGSTRMHMDIADAINVMTFASERADGKEGCAVWHIYRKQDLEILRAFLREKFSAVHQFVDPVHSQLFYLDATLRQELFVKTGVFAHRIYQYPGQAVMIPAYCAHQVCNHSDCIKIACDFVSPHSITRCAKLTEEFRGENVVSDWKDDVLQLNSMMWYTWLYCSKYDSDHQYAPALPFNEATVGTFIDERTQSRPGQTGEGLARLKPSRPTAGKLLQGQLKKDTESPFWAMPESRPAKAGPLVPPKRSVQLSRPAVPPMTRPVDASQPRAGASSLNTSPESQRPHSTTSVVQAPEPSNIVSQRPHDATIYRTTVSSSILHQPGTTETQNRLDGPHPVSDVTDTTVLTTCTAAPIAGLSA